MPNGANPGLEGYFGLGVSHGPNFGLGLDGYIEDPLGGEESGGSILGPSGAKKNEQGDLVTTSLSFLLVHLKIDGTAWAPFLSSGFVGSMALLQVMVWSINVLAVLCSTLHLNTDLIKSRRCLWSDRYVTTFIQSSTALSHYPATSSTDLSHATFLLSHSSLLHTISNYAPLSSISILHTLSYTPISHYLCLSPPTIARCDPSSLLWSSLLV
jgi:hypothetical protein